MRRSGRPPSVKEVRLNELKLRESEEYRTGMGMHRTKTHICRTNEHRYPFLEILDLTNPANVALLRRWTPGDTSFLLLLSYISLRKGSDEIVVTRRGKHETLGEGFGVGEVMEI